MCRLGCTGLSKLLKPVGGESFPLAHDPGTVVYLLISASRWTARPICVACNGGSGH